MISMIRPSKTSIATRFAKANLFSKALLYSKKSLNGGVLMAEAFYLIGRHGLYKQPNNPANTRYIQYFCRKLCQVFNVQVQIHGDMPKMPALWISNHVSWLDVAVLGASARVFFLSKAEVKAWPILGSLARFGGTLFIQRGSGDSQRIRQQITDFLKQDIPVLFFPEATTGDGTRMRKVHGRLLQAAIDAQRPVQMCVLCYVNTQGQLDQVIPFINQQSFLDNVAKVLQTEQVTAHVMALPAIDPAGLSLASLTAEVQQRMHEGLCLLHSQVLAANAAPALS
jgi:1-acyl-sn-glycerol-3-phosphate acyltransferase